jgi:hypothetical protein
MDWQADGCNSFHNRRLLDLHSRERIKAAPYFETLEISNFASQQT